MDSYIDYSLDILRNIDIIKVKIKLRGEKMKVKCPECGKIKDVEDTLEELELIKRKDMAMIICSFCLSHFYAIDNIEYKPPTGGTGEVDPEKSIIPEITLRDYFAGQALVGAMSSDEDRIINDAERAKVSVTELIAISSYRFADAMLKERDK